MSQYGNPSLIQAQKNAVKIARTAIRLKHAVAADTELNEVMPLLNARLSQMAEQGRMPRLTMGDIEKIVNGEDA